MSWIKKLHNTGGTVMWLCGAEPAVSTTAEGGEKASTVVKYCMNGINYIYVCITNPL